MSSLKLGPLCLYSTWNNDLMTSWSRTGSPLGTWFMLVMGTVSMSLCLEPGDKLISTGYTWLTRHGSMCSPLFLASHSTVSNPSTDATWCVVGQFCWWIGGWMIWETKAEIFKVCLVGLNLELPLSLVGPFTGGSENSSLHCVLGTEVPWQLGPERSLCFPPPLYAERKVSHQLYFHSPQAGDPSLPKFAPRLFPLHKVPFW